MNAAVKDKATPINTPVDESNLPISQVSQEERKRRGLQLKETMGRMSKEARERGLTDEVLEELLKDI